MFHSKSDFHDYPFLQVTLHFKGTTSFNVEEEHFEIICHKRGFAYLGHDITDNHITLKIVSFKNISHKRVAKLFIALNKYIPIDSLSICLDSLQKVKKFINDNKLIVGNGWRSFLKRHNNKIIKVFTDPKQGIQSEISARDILKNDSAIIPLLSAGENYIEMPFIENEYKWDAQSLSLYSLEKFNIIFSFLEKINKQNIYMADWNYNSFLFSQGDLKVCDLEFVYVNPEKHEISPDITGIGHPKSIPSNAYSTFDDVWFPALGVYYHEYKTYSDIRLCLLRRIRQFFLFIPRKIFKRINHFMNDIKYQFYIKSVNDKKNIIYTKRQFL